jgi:hypothetical protein
LQGDRYSPHITIAQVGVAVQAIKLRRQKLQVLQPKAEHGNTRFCKGCARGAWIGEEFMRNAAAAPFELSNDRLQKPSVKIGRFCPKNSFESSND